MRTVVSTTMKNGSVSPLKKKATTQAKAIRRNGANNQPKRRSIKWLKKWNN